MVRPVILTLKLKVRFVKKRAQSEIDLLILSDQKANCDLIEAPPRVWWCPTGLFTLLPIHAAGIYDPTSTMESLENVSDYMISSYTPTLRSLFVPPPIVTAVPFSMLAAIQPTSVEGQIPLLQTYEELRKIERHVPTASLIKLSSREAPPSNVETVLGHLPHVFITHFACHGTQEFLDPLASALLLHDGHLDITRIMKLALPNASLAFLSACETAQGDIQSLDEAMHIAATMLFAGFRGVVGTMW